MGDYKDISNLEGFVQSTQDPFVLNPRIKHFFKKSRIVGSGSEPSPISHVALSEEGTLCAIVSGTKTTFYDYSTSSTSHTYSSAKDFLRSASFRSDSKLAGISDDSGTIHLFALPLKSVLRRFKAHKGACHTNAFSMDKTHLMTGGDDQVVNYWDITQQQCISTFSKHVDKVRSLCPMPGDPNIWLTSSYDTFAHLYDVRSGDEPIASVSHKAPIEHVSFASSGLSFVTCGASKVKIWDLASGMNLRHSYKPHTRTVISASYLEEEKILITASLDSSVKYFYAGSELDQFHEYKFESQITSFGVTRSGGTLVTGLSSGEWVIRHNSEGIGAIVEEPVRLVAVGVEKEYTEVVGHKTRKFKPLDRLMKEFQYQAALEMAIGMGPTHVFNVVECLIMRGVLDSTLRGKNETSILPLLQFISSHFKQEPNRIDILTELLLATIRNNKWIETCTDPNVISQVAKLLRKVNFELYQHSLLMQLKGSLDLITRAA